MPRGAREKSSSGIYHIIFRGINKQQIFNDREDYRVLLDKLQSYQKTSGYELYAYCLMNNHIHLLIEEGLEPISTVFQRFGTSFVYWYNQKYNRCGHLFQDRYRSESVETDQYFLTVLRYIHQNPLKAGLTKDLSDYPWSSYREYLGEPVYCNPEFALSIFSGDQNNAREKFIQFNQEVTEERCLEHDYGTRLNDEEAIKLIFEITGFSEPQKINDLNKQERKQIVRSLKDRGLSIRQIERLTGVSFASIRSV